MSSLTDEWHLKRENGIKYCIDVYNFRKKMNWPCGKEVYSRKFKISESVFRIEINPNGLSSKEKGYVSIYLRNESSWRVRCSDITFKVGHHERTMDDDYYQADQSWGLPKFVSHYEIEMADLLNEENRLTLEVDVELLEEEVTASRPVDNEGDVLLSLKNEISSIKEDLKSQRTEMKDMKKELNQGMNEIKNMIVGNSSLRRPANVECPVCMEEVRAPMRLRQCGEGHIICDACFHQNQGNRSMCFICRGAITGEEEIKLPIYLNSTFHRKANRTGESSWIDQGWSLLNVTTRICFRIYTTASLPFQASEYILPHLIH